MSDKAIEFLISKPGYRLWGDARLAKLLEITEQDARKAKKLSKIYLDKAATESKLENVLIIADTHKPFTLDTYLEFCIHTKIKYNCTKVIHVGDVIDNHYSSFHPTDADGYAAGEELDRAIDMLQEWYKVFPEVTVLLGNHDLIISRKAFKEGISQRWIKGLKDVLQVPQWEFVETCEHQDVWYEHGTGTSGANAAYNRALHRGQSVVQGHLHSQASVQYVNQNVFGMVVRCGVDQNKYAFNYAKSNKKPFIVSCGVIVQGTPIIETLR